MNGLSLSEMLDLLMVSSRHSPIMAAAMQATLLCIDLPCRPLSQLVIFAVFLVCACARLERVGTCLKQIEPVRRATFMRLHSSSEDFGPTLAQAALSLASVFVLELFPLNRIVRASLMAATQENDPWQSAVLAANGLTSAFKDMCLHDQSLNERPRLSQEGMEIATLAACTVCGAYIARRSIWARRPCPGPDQALRGLANQKRRLARGLHPLMDAVHKQLRVEFRRQLELNEMLDAEGTVRHYLELKSWCNIQFEPLAAVVGKRFCQQSSCLVWQVCSSRPQELAPPKLSVPLYIVVHSKGTRVPDSAEGIASGEQLHSVQLKQRTPQLPLLLPSGTK
eukprot:927535-Amphidinium_carterae.1